MMRKAVDITVKRTIPAAPATIASTTQMCIRDRDYGRGIADIARAREPMYTTGGSDRSGMGFTVMESFMDELRVRSREGVGTTVTMVKRVRPRK